MRRVCSKTARSLRQGPSHALILICLAWSFLRELRGDLGPAAKLADALGLTGCREGNFVVGVFGAGGDSALAEQALVEGRVFYACQLLVD